MSKVDNNLETIQLRERSGTFKSSHPLVAVFYDLIIKTGIPIGELETFVREACAYAAEDKIYTNGYIAEYAEDLTVRLELARAKYRTLSATQAQRYYDSLLGQLSTTHEVWKEVVHSILTGQYRRERPR